MSVLPRDYHNLFIGTHGGQDVLDDLIARFDAVMSYVPGGVEGARQTDFNEGKRLVIKFILETLANAEENNQVFPKL